MNLEVIKNMTNYQALLYCELNNLCLEIKEVSTGLCGVCNSKDKGVMVFVGNDCGEHDRCVSVEEFNKDFTITNVVEN